MLAIVLVGGGALVFAALVFVVSSANRQRREVIAATLSDVGATDVRARGFGLDAVVRGVSVHWHLLGGGRGNPVHTICSVPLEQPPRFLMDLRRQTGEELQQVRAGRAIDVIVGDEAFDDAFIVEAAPSDVARKLLDAETRRRLLGLRPLRLGVVGNTLWLDVVGVVGQTIAKSMLELVLLLSRRLAEMPRAMAEERMTTEAREAGGAVYRGTTPGSSGAIEEWSPQAEKEMAALMLARKRRDRRTWVAICVGLAVWLAFSSATMRCAQR